ncbi:phage minor head protein [Methylobacterium sp. P1-11]|uniref:phage head morphogenesis protein n=1 Tax=Methylobacterium sp. P1-11 TaxID=2024616 RepID=UPI0018D6340D|nr:phage minor head protein [Methylobacterium sp. P1-11]
MTYHHRFAQDRAGTSARSAFKRALKLERSYAQRLRGIARHIGDIVKGFAWETLEEIAASSEPAQRLLRRYADTLDPWANAVAQRMVAEVAASDRVSWRKLSSDMGRQLHREIDTAPTGEAMRASMQRQVGLIKSLPLDAAERVHKLTQEGITQGRRAAEIADEIMASGDVARSRAMLIARTEVSRTATELTKARAEHIGSTHFIWRTAGDSDVRSTHKVLNGKTFRWDQPPECDPGHHALPGGIWNCRCYPEVVVPDLD